MSREEDSALPQKMPRHSCCRLSLACLCRTSARLSSPLLAHLFSPGVSQRQVPIFSTFVTFFVSRGMSPCGSGRVSVRISVLPSCLCSCLRLSKKSSICSCLCLSVRTEIYSDLKNAEKWSSCLHDHLVIVVSLPATHSWERHFDG